MGRRTVAFAREGGVGAIALLTANARHLRAGWGLAVVATTGAEPCATLAKLKNDGQRTRFP